MRFIGNAFSKSFEFLNRVWDVFQLYNQTMHDFKCGIVGRSRNLSSLVRVNFFSSLSSQWRKVVTYLTMGRTEDSSLCV